MEEFDESALHFSGAKLDSRRTKRFRWFKKYGFDVVLKFTQIKTMQPLRQQIGKNRKVSKTFLKIQTVNNHHKGENTKKSI